MDILSFILGMSIVVVIVVAIVAVIAFVKVNKHNKEIEIIHTIMGNEFERVKRDREEDIKNVYSTLDSRLDKLESKVITSRKA
jgi:cell division protein ZapA (FtsZ GTPase activity inhibitor)